MIQELGTLPLIEQTESRAMTQEEALHSAQQIQQLGRRVAVVDALRRAIDTGATDADLIAVMRETEENLILAPLEQLAGLLIARTRTGADGWIDGVLQGSPSTPEAATGA